MLTASNPKDLLFFVGFLPVFLDLQDPDPFEIFIASIVIVISFLATLSFYAVLASHARQWFKSKKSIIFLHRIAGTLMIGAGLFVIFT
jgi:threonine/homoserine/homoserine lactone efflux protein